MCNPSSRCYIHALKCDVWVKPERNKMWLIVFLAGCLVLAQYHIVNSWVAPSPMGIPIDQHLPTSVDSVGINAQAIKNYLLAKLRSDRNLIAGVEEKTLKEIVNKLTEGCVIEERQMRIIPPLYIITPTYRRPEQIAELTRLAQTLMHVQNVHWLVIEDAKEKTPHVTELLSRTGISFEHLLAPMPESYKLRKGSKPRGVSNRNRGLEWLRENATSGVFYFADDDNTYDIKIFEEMRSTEKVSMWPVGLCTKTGLSTPILKNGSFSGFFDGWIAGRKFPVDMAGFAVSVKFLLERPRAAMPYKPGFEEDGFLKSLAPFEPKQIEFKAQNCTKILVWHTQTRKNEPALAIDTAKYGNTNLIMLRQQIV